MESGARSRGLHGKRKPEPRLTIEEFFGGRRSNAKAEQKKVRTHESEGDNEEDEEEDDLTDEHDPINEDDISDEDDLVNNEEGLEDLAINQKYGLKDDESFWWAYNSDSHDFDLHDEAICDKIRRGWNIEKDFLAAPTTDLSSPTPPSNSLLREMRQEKRDLQSKLCTDTMKFKLWLCMLAGGLKSSDRMEVKFLPSLERIDRERKAEKAEKEAADVKYHNDQLDFLESYGIKLPKFKSDQEALESAQRRVGRLSAELAKIS